MGLFDQWKFSLGISPFEGPIFTVSEGDEETIDKKAKRVTASLDIETNAHQAVKNGYHLSRETKQSPTQHEITLTFANWRDHEMERYDAAQAQLVDQQTILKQDPADNDFVTITVRLEKDLESTFVAFDQKISDLAKGVVEAEEVLKDYEDANDATGRDLPSTKAGFAKSAIPAAIGEGFLSLLLFRSELGGANALGYGITFALLLLLPAMVGGWGFYKGWKAPKADRSRLVGGIAVATGLALFAALSFLIVHYRAALQRGANDLAEATATSMVDSPFTFGSDLPIVAFVVVSSAVAFEAARRFGDMIIWRRLGQLRKAYGEAKQRLMDFYEATVLEVTSIGLNTENKRADLLARARVATSEAADLRDTGRFMATDKNDEFRRIKAEHFRASKIYRETVIADLRKASRDLDNVEIHIDRKTDINIVSVAPRPELDTNFEDLIKRDEEWKGQAAQLAKDDAAQIQAMLKRIYERRIEAEMDVRRKKYATLKIVSS